MSHDRGHGVHTMTPIILGDATYREQPGIPRLEQQLLEFVCCSDLSTLCRLVNPLLEAEDMPVHLLPWHVLPGHHQGWTLCFGALPLTHGFTFHDTGPTSAYPECYLWPWLLRASSSPTACGGHLLWKVTFLPKSWWGLLRSQLSLVASVGRCSPPGFLTVQTGHWFRMPVSYPVPFGSSASAS
jgi:hypothetical protein